MSASSPVGTIAYIIEEEALLVRVNKGWQYIAVSKKILFKLKQTNIYILHSNKIHKILDTHISYRYSMVQWPIIKILVL